MLAIKKVNVFFAQFCELVLLKKFGQQLLTSVLTIKCSLLEKGILKMRQNLKILQSFSNVELLCSTSRSGGNQVDGSPPAEHNMTIMVATIRFKTTFGSKILENSDINFSIP